MPERSFSSGPRPTTGSTTAFTSTVDPKISLDPVVLHGTLTPHGLFTNLFRVAMPDGALGPVRAARTERAQRDEFDGWRRPAFYQARDVLYAYGPGVEEFTDRRFTSAIVTAETNRNFTKYLLGLGLMNYLREKQFIVRRDAQGFSVQDHGNIISSSKKGVLHIIPQFSFQPYWVECTGGATRFAFAIEPGTTTLPTFRIHAGLARFAAELEGLRLQLTEKGCEPGCPLYGRNGEVIGRFHGFADADAELDCRCHEDSFDAVPIVVVDRHPKPGTPRRRRGRPETDRVERVLTIPGQLVKAAPAQRRLLRLSIDREELEREGRVWLGDLTKNRTIRTNALQVRYERIQEFLARLAGSQTGPVPFMLPTGASVAIERLPLTVEELADQQ